MGGRSGGGPKREEAPDVGIIHLLDWSVGDIVWPHHVLEAEGRMWHRLLRNALRKEAEGQVQKGAGKSHHQFLRPHLLNHLRYQVGDGWRLSHRSLLFLLQKKTLNSTSSFRIEGSSATTFCRQTRCSSSFRIFSFASSTSRTSGFTPTMPANAVEKGGSHLRRLASSISSSSSLLMAMVSSTA